MFRWNHSARPRSTPPVRGGSTPASRPHPPGESEPGEAYGRTFWLAYAANTSLMVSVSLLFRYGDFVNVLSGAEVGRSARTLGLIVGIGMIGSLAMRLAQGAGIDRYGPRRIWLASLVVVVATLLAHLAITRVDTPTIYLVRIAYQSGLAGAFGASITYISLRASTVRMAEVIGMLGSSGFIGMALGAWLGDLLARTPTLDRAQVDRLFIASAILASGSLVCAWLATQGAVRPLRRRSAPVFWLVRRYHPGTLLLIGVAMGVGVSLPNTFLRPYTEQLQIPQIGTFFGVYAATAFVMRVATRRFSDRFGTRPTVLMGMAAIVASLLLYLPVQSAWQLIFPGVAAGIGHALLFPAVVAGGSRTFPARHRGLGITLILAMFDLGNLVGMPLAGTIVDVSHRWNLPPYPTMFVAVAGILTTASLLYLATTPRRRASPGTTYSAAPPAEESKEGSCR